MNCERGNPKRSIFLFVMVAMGFFMVMLDVTVVNVALEAIGKGLVGHHRQLQWVINSYTLTLASSLLVWGALCDRFGAHRIFLLGLLIFVVGSSLCGMARSMSYLFVARSLQGLGGACLIPSSLALVNRLSTDPKQIAQFIGWWGGLGGVAAAVGPLLGGVVTDQWGWQFVFFINIPVACGVMVMMIVNWGGLDTINNVTKVNFDFVGSLMITVVMILSCYLVISNGSQPLWLKGCELLGVVVLIIVFFIRTKQVSNPLVPLRLLTNNRFQVANLIGFCLNFSFFGELFVLSLYLQQQMRLQSLYAGLALFPQTCSAIIAAPLGGKFASRWGNLLAIQIGLAVGILGFVFLNFIDWDVPFVLIALCSFMVGFGMAFAMPAATNLAVRSADRGEGGIASGVINTSRQFGSVMGVSVIGLCFEAFGIHVVFTISALVFGIAFLFSLSNEKTLSGVNT